MNCTLAQESLSQWMDGELSIAIEPELFLHISTCEHCRYFFRTLQTVHQELASAPPVQVPASLDQRILAMRAFAPTEKPRVPWLLPGRLFSARAVGLAVVLTMVMTVFLSSFWYHHSQPQQTIVCLTPLPEVEVTGYVVVASSPTQGTHQ